MGFNIDANEEGFDYACAAQVSSFATLPAGCEKIVVAPAEYAVFSHETNVIQIGETCCAIWNEWLPENGARPAATPGLER